jgi:HEPN domain-containing protein
MTERWMRDSITALKSAIEKLNHGEEGDFKQALMIADQAIETIMRNYLIFKENIDPPYDYPSLLKEVSKRVSIPPDVTDTIQLFRLIRDGFYHYNLKKIDKALKSTTTGLTLEKSFLEDYLNAVCLLFKFLTNIQIDIGGNQNAETD